jgi:hypothetical protein
MFSISGERALKSTKKPLEKAAQVFLNFSRFNEFNMPSFSKPVTIIKASSVKLAGFERSEGVAIRDWRGRYNWIAIARIAIYLNLNFI